jgi:hypothetical protein
MLSFVDSVTMVVDKIGTENVGLVWGLSMANWDSYEDLSGFLDAITRPSAGV